MALVIDGAVYLSASEVAERLDISRQTLWRWRQDGREERWPCWDVDPVRRLGAETPDREWACYAAAPSTGGTGLREDAPPSTGGTGLWKGAIEECYSSDEAGAKILR